MTSRDPLDGLDPSMIRWKGGVRTMDSATWFDGQRAALPGELAGSPCGAQTRPLELAAHVEAHLTLGLVRWRAGERDEARRQLGAGLDDVLRGLTGRMAALEPRQATNHARELLRCAIVAGLLGRPDDARALFALAADCAVGRVPGRTDLPVAFGSAFNYGGEYHLTHAYALIRLGRLGPVEAPLFPEPLPPRGSISPVWGRTDVFGVLDTAARSMGLGPDKLPASRRLPASPAERGLEPVLRSLAARLRDGPGPARDAAARAAWEAYRRAVRDAGCFVAIVPRLLDLAAAYPEVYC